MNTGGFRPGARTTVASMLLARASGRQKEIGIRLAIGASRWRLVQQLLSESLVMAVLGADGVALSEFDYVDIGALIPSSGAVPVVIKSLIFPNSAATQ